MRQSHGGCLEQLRQQDLEAEKPTDSITQWKSTNKQGSEFNVNTKVKSRNALVFYESKELGTRRPYVKEIGDSEAINMCHDVVLELYVKVNCGPLEGFKSGGVWSVSSIIHIPLKGSL